MPAPTRSRSATTPGTRTRRWCSSSARRKLIRPINYPTGTPGRGAALFEARNGAQCAGRSMPWAASSWIRSTIRLRRSSASSSLCPLKARRRRHHHRHACGGDQREAGDGPFLSTAARACVVGTHTHVPTADHRILAGGTAFISDVGMSGDYDSVIGMAKDEPLSRFLRRIPTGAFRAGRRTGNLVRARGRDR